jgi:hypothetical protein
MELHILPISMCPWKRHGESKTRKKAPPPPATKDQHFDLFCATVDRRTMKEMVSHLQEGWYGKGETYLVGLALHKATDDCNTLFGVPGKAAATKCIPQCKGSSGTITTLATDSTYLHDEVDIHLDVLVLDFTRVDKEVDDFGH